MGKKQVPAIRFQGFTDAWEQRKLGELLEFHNGFNGSSEKYGRGIPLISVMDILSNDFITSENIRIKADLTEKEFQRFKVGYGDVLFQRSSENVEDAGTSNVYLDERKCAVFGGFVICGKKKAEYVSLFLKYGLTNKGVRAQITSKAQGAQHINVSQDTLQGTVILLPSQYEQEKIGNYFRYLDALITLHQRKYEKLLKVKKSMLEKMFPRDGADVPEIRFDGFTDAWEQRKLSEITDKVTEKNAGLQYVETFTNSAEFGIISQRDFFDHDIAKLGSLDGYYIVKDEDFVYNPRISTSAPVGPINRNKLGRTGVMSPLYTVFRPHDIDTTYLEHFFKCDYWHSFMNFNGDSGARSDRFSIRDNVFFQMPIPIPDIDEQRKIGELLTCLDHLITLHQRKLEKLKNIKKSLLEKMFV